MAGRPGWGQNSEQWERGRGNHTKTSRKGRKRDANTTVIEGAWLGKRLVKLDHGGLGKSRTSVRGGQRIRKGECIGC